MVVIFSDFLIFYQIFCSPQVKQSVIICKKHGIYELSHELPNDFRLRILGNWKISIKSQNFTGLQPSTQPFMQNELSMLPKTTEKQTFNFSRSVLFYMKTRVCLKYFVHHCLWKQVIVSELSQSSLNFICLTILVTLRLLTQF